MQSFSPKHTINNFIVISYLRIVQKMHNKINIVYININNKRLLKLYEAKFMKYSNRFQ